MNVDSFRIISFDVVTDEGHRAELYELENLIVELRYYDSQTIGIYRSWKISATSLIALSSFLRSIQSGLIVIPTVQRVSEGEFSMLSEKSVFIKESDSYGNLKMIGANLPIDLVTSLCKHISAIMKGV